MSETLLTRQILSYVRKIKDLFHNTITEVTLYGSAINQYKIDSSPALRRKIESLLSGLHNDIRNNILQSIAEAWELSRVKNDSIEKAVTGNIIYDPNKAALIAFSTRKERGMNLSQRVWNLVEPFKYELEAGLTDGISKGKSAASMARTMKQYLNEPDVIFKRVGKDYHPGQGVYKSSFKNAIRLTATETNMSYRTADHERWKTQTFVKGIEIRTSNNHPEFDECDALAGVYPKEYKFVGWHPRCMCNAVPILVTDDEYSKLEDYQLGLTRKRPQIDYVKDIPEQAKDWIAENAERINGWKNTPYWVKDNVKYVKNLLQ